MRFILSAKPGDHEWLFDWVNNSDEVETYSYKGGKKQITLRWLNNVPLSDSRSDLLVNFLECVVLPNKIVKLHLLDLWI
jgi:hypothetical protein